MEEFVLLTFNGALLFGSKSRILHIEEKLGKHKNAKEAAAHLLQKLSRDRLYELFVTEDDNSNESCLLRFEHPMVEHMYEVDFGENIDYYTKHPDEFLDLTRDTWQEIDSFAIVSTSENMYQLLNQRHCIIEGRRDIRVEEEEQTR